MLPEVLVTRILSIPPGLPVIKTRLLPPEVVLGRIPLQEHLLLPLQLTIENQVPLFPLPIIGAELPLDTKWRNTTLRGISLTHLSLMIKTAMRKRKVSIRGFFI